MPGEPVDTERKREDKVRPLRWLLSQGLEDSETKPAAWDLVRALAIIGFVLFAATTTLRWLYLNFSKPFTIESIEVRGAYTIPPHIAHDYSLLRRWLPREGRVGYLSEKPELLRLEMQQRLAPLLLDPNWSRDDLVLVDVPPRRDKAIVESPSYQLLGNLTDAQSFAIGMRIYRRKP